MQPRKPMNKRDIENAIRDARDVAIDLYKEVGNLKKHKNKQIVKDFAAMEKADFLALTAAQKYELIFDVLKEII